MDFELPEEHQLAYESAFAFARDEIKPHNAEIERTDDFPPWIWKRLAEQGYTGIAIPEEHGGSGGGFFMWATVTRAIRRPNASFFIAYGAHQNTFARNFMPDGAAGQKHE